MRAFILDRFDAEPAVRDGLPEPRASEGELIVRVHASSVNPVDALIAGGSLRERAEHEFPVTLGRDFAGTVEQAGAGVSRYRLGDEVYGYVPHLNPTIHDGSWSELITVSEDGCVYPKPRGVETSNAGAAVLAGITAVAIVDALAPSEGETVFVVGATGGVGSFVVQLAASAGATVIAAALPDDEVYLRGIGVDVLVDRDGDAGSAVREWLPDGVDGVADLVSAEPDSAPLKEDGRLASPRGAAGEGPGRFNVMARPTPANLERLGALLDAGTLQVCIQQTYSLERAGEAIETLQTTHTQGKLGVQIA